MAGRFPGAANTAEFWRNLANVVESILPLRGEVRAFVARILRFALLLVVLYVITLAVIPSLFAYPQYLARLTNIQP